MSAKISTTRRPMILRLLALFMLCAWVMQDAWAGPSVSITSPANNSTYAVPASITLAANVTPEKGTTITRVEFIDTNTTPNTSLGIVLTAPYTIVLNSVAEGTYVYKVIATDSNSKSTSSGKVTVTVIPPQLTVSITSPASNSTYITQSNLSSLLISQKYRRHLDV